MKSVLRWLHLVVWLLAMLLVVASAIAQQNQATQTEAPHGPPKKKVGKPPAPTKEIEWQNDLDKAMKLAQENGRPVITYFTFDT